MIREASLDVAQLWHFEPFGYTSLNQVLWIDRELLWDDWWLRTTESDIAHAGRAFTPRILHTRDGRPVASMVQEQIIARGG